MNRAVFTKRRCLMIILKCMALLLTIQSSLNDHMTISQTMNQDHQQRSKPSIKTGDADKTSNQNGPSKYLPVGILMWCMLQT